jgi:hypothetical protein
VEVEAIAMGEVCPKTPGHLGAAARKRLIWGDHLVDVPVSGLFDALESVVRFCKEHGAELPIPNGNVWTLPTLLENDEKARLALMRARARR